MLKEFSSGDSIPAITKEIDQELINGWAALSGDFNKLHVDSAYARKTRFGGTIAHGPLSLAFLNEAMLSCFGLSWARGGSLREVRFLAPIRPGDQVIISGLVETVTDQGSAKSITCRLKISKQGEEIEAVSGLAEVALEGAGS